MTVTRETPSSGQNFKQYFVFLLWGERWPIVQIHTRSWAVDGFLVRDLNKIRNLCQKTLRKSYVDRPLE